MAKRELNLARQSATKQNANGDLSDRAVVVVALPATQRPVSLHTNELYDATLLDAEQALVGSNDTLPDEGGLVVECGRGVRTEPASTCASAVDHTDDSATTMCNGTSASG